MNNVDIYLFVFGWSVQPKCRSSEIQVVVESLEGLDKFLDHSLIILTFHLLFPNNQDDFQQQHQTMTQCTVASTDVLTLTVLCRQERGALTSHYHR